LTVGLGSLQSRIRAKFSWRLPRVPPEPLSARHAHAWDSLYRDRQCLGDVVAGTFSNLADGSTVNATSQPLLSQLRSARREMQKQFAWSSRRYRLRPILPAYLGERLLMGAVLPLPPAVNRARPPHRFASKIISARWARAAKPSSRRRSLLVTKRH
jgi:hypothetical protein